MREPKEANILNWLKNPQMGTSTIRICIHGHLAEMAGGTFEMGHTVHK